MQTGLLVVVSSPSGGGKDSIIAELVKRISGSTRLVTTTSRTPRPGNIDGVDYYFVDRQSFEEKIHRDELVEYNMYAGNYYGIEKTKLDKTMSQYHVILSQIEVHGKHSLDKLGIAHLSIFLLPESLDILAERIRRRGGISEEKLKERMEIARREIEESKDYDYRIINEDGAMSKTVQKIQEIIEETLGEKAP